MANVDKLTEHIGDFGPFQKKMVVLGSLPLVLIAFVFVGVVFLGHTPDHWCWSPGSEQLLQECGWTEVKVREVTVPHGEEAWSFSRCQAFAVNLSQSRDKCEEFEQALTLNAVPRDGRWMFDKSHKTTIFELGTF